VGKYSTNRCFLRQRRPASHVRHDRAAVRLDQARHARPTPGRRWASGSASGSATVSPARSRPEGCAAWQAAGSRAGVSQAGRPWLAARAAWPPPSPCLRTTRARSPYCVLLVPVEMRARPLEFHLVLEVCKGCGRWGLWACGTWSFWHPREEHQRCACGGYGDRVLPSASSPGQGTAFHSLLLRARNMDRKRWLCQQA